ncbi:UDP-N-acetylglucosamine--N-acetylmuramyl-(pentapeptide) pyrophosphoryl-undecaprenol N-acetylglucosamine transferase [Candidatus Saccharibacteria bacterium]|nr:UDP-N-acetylglucosamine--N-acetylmuramyl-(pentapeptide) pyrophosphoryl-undecaprenol N-acetylglucosamine transferase [Candidatus Saccharibacteria bacterium]
MKILVVGGGSGGHITPAVAVVREILKLKPRARVEFWTDRKYYKNVVKITTEIGVGWGDEARLSGKRQYIRVRKVMAGKFHRYASWKLKDYFENFGTTLKDIVWGNIVGFFGFIGGIFQSFFRMVLKENRPDVIFLKGGFVGLPVGLVARLLKIPYVVHESDAVPGLANRILMRHARVVALSGHSSSSADALLVRGTKSTAHSDAPASSNNTPDRATKSTAQSVVVTGVPVAPEFRVVSKTRQEQLKKAFGFPVDKPLVVVTGGSQGALHIDEAIREILPEMLKFASVGLVAGRKLYEDMVDLKKYETWDKAKLQSNFRMWAFNSAMHELLGAADVVISRAGATTIAELAALKKAVILVPFEKLPGSHQVKNAERLVEMGAVAMIGDERMVEQPGVLLELTQKLVSKPKIREDLARKLHETYKPEAALDLAKILISEAQDVM